MPSPVVDAFEEVDIHHQRADLRRLGTSRSFSNSAIKLGEEAATRAESRQLVALGHLMKLLLKLRLRLVKHSELHQVVSDLYLVAVLKQLLRCDLRAIQKSTVRRVEIIDVVFDAVCLQAQLHYLRVLARCDLIAQDKIGLRPATYDSALLFQLNRFPD